MSEEPESVTVTAVEGGHITSLEETNKAIREGIEKKSEAKIVEQCCTDKKTLTFADDDEEEVNEGMGNPEPLPGVFDSCCKSEEKPPAEVLLEDAQQVTKQRRRSYGPPTEHFMRTVSAINSVFRHKLVAPLTPSDWAQIMILDKLARHQGSNKNPDTPIDLAGYAACLAECEEFYGE